MQLEPRQEAFGMKVVFARQLERFHIFQIFFLADRASFSLDGDLRKTVDNLFGCRR